ncbi:MULTISPECIES: hypothetical protein [unclassified Variovorax]|uniref:hypothetical protein n=1 Tax=unclassified Variovorax TaxID=663243 RepID=UPI000838A2D9|nr:MULTISPECIES: hypothetical protein [unclassified Variovorax]PNG47545.1 hypothetical protein CHC06_07896 [Variovorax sp. B2]PNG47804.1 hypothetical protein CHC07_06972 [Variovorax sp. B4]VTV14108.1 hypothetical protein WDL1CHR_04688 [Variovorax sp. WDL1]
MKITRNADAAPRGEMSWETRWDGPDKGLIVSWERGREKRREDPGLAARAVAGELVVLPWKGGVERAIKARKYGPFHYLAMWQGLRGDPLEIDTSAEVTLVCSKFGVSVTFTADDSKYRNAV